MSLALGKPQSRSRYQTRYAHRSLWQARSRITLAPQQFSLSPNPHEWGANLSLEYKEADDYIHNPDPKRDRNTDQGGTVFTYRGLTNLGCLSILVIGLVSLL